MADNFRDERIDHLQAQAKKTGAQLSGDLRKKEKARNKSGRLPGISFDTRGFVGGMVRAAFVAAAAYQFVPEVQRSVDAAISEARGETASPYAPATSPRPRTRG